MTKLDWNKFEPLFGSWAYKFKPFFMSGGLDPVYEFLKFEGKRGKRIAPISSLVYRCFQETNINNTKVVLISMCPYHTFVNNNSIPVADGLAFSCSVTGKLQPSLATIYNGLEQELYNGLNLTYNKNPDLSYLAKEGVLLYNCALTTEMGKAGNHISIWENFTKYFLEEVISYTGIPLVFIGKDAQKFNRYVTPLTHGQIFNIEHPSAAARENREWETNNTFKKLNRIIWENNKVKINWLQQDDN